MQKIPQIDAASAPAKTQDLLTAVTKQMGGVPNILATMAQSSAALGKGAGLSSDEMAKNLLGKSSDPKTAALLGFAREFVRLRGRTSDAQLATLGAAGFGHEEIVEIVANVALNIFTNYFNHIAGTEIDFPLVNAQIALAA